MRVDISRVIFTVFNSIITICHHLRRFIIGLESGNRSIASLETQMVRRRWIPVQVGLHEAAALRPWMLVPESLVALAAERLTYIGVSKTNDHSRELTVPVQKTELVQTKVK
ncbi:Hypothetical_protein [Hexamita inflata]|uniref:Hypothetical_protein n=1 Tax=Hexamita inflata TaxID=28002 RepID=A0AA86R8Q9_9EUKA|nr:Hypothetical protein HINF_LOCUS44665 [Hexamita inflata]CAI9970403.1 Hypothetical protein HINF_LOCUS58048 [Hexamita inflata]